MKLALGHLWRFFWRFLSETCDPLSPQAWELYPKSSFCHLGWKLGSLCPTTAIKIQVGKNKTSKMDSQYALSLHSYFSSAINPTSQILHGEIKYKHWQQFSMLRGGSGSNTSLVLIRHSEFEVSYSLLQRIITSLALLLLPAV